MTQGVGSREGCIPLSWEQPGTCFPPPHLGAQGRHRGRAIGYGGGLRHAGGGGLGHLPIDEFSFSVMELLHETG